MATEKMKEKRKKDDPPPNEMVGQERMGSTITFVKETRSEAPNGLIKVRKEITLKNGFKLFENAHVKPEILEALDKALKEQERPKQHETASEEEKHDDKNMIVKNEEVQRGIDKFVLILEQDDTKEPDGNDELEDEDDQSVDDPSVAKSDMVTPGFESSFSRLRAFERPEVFDSPSPGTQARRSWKPKAIDQSTDVHNEADTPSLVQNKSKDTELNQSTDTDNPKDITNLEQDDSNAPIASDELGEDSQSVDDPVVSQSDPATPGLDSSFSRLRAFNRPEVFDSPLPGTQAKRSWKPKGIIEIDQRTEVEEDKADAVSSKQDDDKDTEINQSIDRDKPKAIPNLEQDDGKGLSASDALDEDAQSVDDPLVTESDMSTPGLESSFSRLRAFERPGVFDSPSPGTQAKRSWKPKGIIEIDGSTDVDSEEDAPRSEQEIVKNSGTDQSSDAVLKSEQDDSNEPSASNELDEDSQSVDDPLVSQSDMSQSDMVTTGLASSFSSLRAFDRPDVFDSASPGTQAIRRSWRPKGVIEIPSSKEDDRKDIEADQSLEHDESKAQSALKAPNDESSPEQHDEPRMQLVMLISTYPDSLYQQMPKQKRIMTIFQALNIVPELVDGANPEQKHRRNDLFRLSGHRAYPQFFVMDERGNTGYFGDFETIEVLNDCGTLVDEIQASKLESKGVVGIEQRADAEKETAVPCSKQDENKGIEVYQGTVVDNEGYVFVDVPSLEQDDSNAPSDELNEDAQFVDDQVSELESSFSKGLRAFERPQVFDSPSPGTQAKLSWKPKGIIR
jgi:hypothetical protein